MQVIVDESRKRPLRVRGQVRKEKLLDAACELLSDKNPVNITFKDVYEHAGVPPSSAYHFFDNIEEIITSLKERFNKDLNESLDTPLDTESINTWSDIANELIDRVSLFYNKNPAARKALILSRLNQGIIYASDKRDGIRTENIFDRYFILQRTSNLSLRFVLTVKIVNLVFAISITQYGQITDEMCNEAKTAAIGYLKMYLPEKLDKRLP